MNINADAALGNGGAVVFGGGTLQAAVPVTLSPSRTVSINNAATAVIDTNGNAMSIGAINGASANGLTKVGGNTLTLASKSTYLGTTLISGGTVKLGTTSGVSAASLLASATVNLDANSIASNSTTVASWTNNGTAGGAFTDGTAIQTTNTDPVYNATAINGHPALVFTGPAAGDSNGHGTALIGQTAGNYVNGNQVSIFVVENQTAPRYTNGYATEMSLMGTNLSSDYTVQGNIGINDANGASTGIRTVTNNNQAGAVLARPNLGTPLVWGTVFDATAQTSVADLLTASSSATATGTGNYTAAGPFDINTISLGGRIGADFTAGLCEGDWTGQIGQVLIFNTALDTHGAGQHRSLFERQVAQHRSGVHGHAADHHAGAGRRWRQAGPERIRSGSELPG